MSKTTYDNITINCFPDGFKMVLPDGYRIDTEYDENYDQIAHLRGGFKYNEYGEEDFTFTCSFMQFNINITEMKKDYKVVPGALLDEVAKGVMENLENQFGEGVKLNLYNSFPASTVIKFYKPLSLFGITMASYIVFYLVEVSESVMFGFQTVYQDDGSGNTEFYKHLLNVIKAVRVDGKSVDTGKLTPTKLEKALSMEADESVEALDLGLSVGINIQNGDEETDSTIDSDGSISEENGEMLLEYSIPDESLYPHYNSRLQAQGLRMPGVKVVVNQSGTDYQFYNLKEDIDEDASEKMRTAVNKLSDKGASSYDLAVKAEQMRTVFRVSEDIFDTGHDKECELAQGMMKSAYLMSALRSFAWTLAKHCDDTKTNPSELNLEQIHRIIDFVADNRWLNYDGSSFCKSLCGTQDLHIYYLPDNTSKEVRAVFEPSKKTIEETKAIQEKFPNFNPILEQVGSLDGLRKDLEYIYPAIEKVYEDLKANRNISEPLEGNHADILYAWCALAHAARGPFFSEDGPVNCFFSQENTPVDFGEKKTKNTDSSSWGQSVTADDDVERQKNELNRQVEELRAQADLYSTQNLSAEDRETLAQAQEGIDRLGEQINEISEKQDTLAQHIKRQEEEKKKREEEKKIKKAEMLEKLTEDDVTIDMFVVLSNESRLGKLRRKQDEFFKLYEEDFPTLNKKEMIAKRKEVLEKMKDEEICATYTENFKQRSLKERFDVSTSNYFNLSNKVEEAMDATAEWYERNEYPELRRMLKEHIGNQTKRLDDQLIPVEKNWTKFSTAKSNLEIVITDDSDVVYNFDQFQLKLGGAMVEVNLNSGGVYQLIINAMNCFTWYWDVDVLSIWEAALKNNVRNNATSYFDVDRLAKDAIQEIRKKYPLRNKDFQDKAHRFIRMVLDEYEGETLDDNPTNAIKEMMDKCFEDESAFSESRRYIAQDKDLSKIPALNEIIDCGIPASMAYKEIPEALGAEITAINKDKLVKKKEQDIEEIRESLSDGSMTGLLKSIELLNGLKKHDDSDDIMIDNQHIDDLIKTCSDRVEDAKEKQYQEALALIDDSTVSSLKEAVELMEGLEDYKDSAKKAEETRNIMGDEILYSEAIADIDEGSAESLLSAIRLLEAVKTYKDSADLLDDIRNKLDNVIIHFNEKAKNMLISGDRNDIDDAAAIYAYIKTIDFDKTRKSLYEERLRTIEKLRNLYDELLGLRDEHANLGGFFKKRQRLENEEKTRKTEERIKMLLAAIE